MAKSIEQIEGFNNPYTYPTKPGDYWCRVKGDENIFHFDGTYWFPILKNGKPYKKHAVWHRTYVFWKSNNANLPCGALPDLVDRGQSDDHGERVDQKFVPVSIQDTVLSQTVVAINELVQAIPATSPRIRLVTGAFEFSFYTTAKDQSELSHTGVTKAFLSSLQARLEGGNVLEGVRLEDAVPVN